MKKEIDIVNKLVKFEEMKFNSSLAFYNFLTEEIASYKNNISANELILFYISLYNGYSFNNLNIIPCDKSIVRFKTNLDEEIYNIFNTMKKEKYGDKVVFFYNEEYEVHEGDRVYTDLIKERVFDQRFSVKNFVSFYNLIIDGYEYEYGHFFNQSLFVETWFSFYQKLKKEQYFMRKSEINKIKFLEGLK